MELPKQLRGVLLFFPLRESATPRPKNETCAECERLDAAYQTIIDEINAVVRGPFASVGEKLARLFEKQDERDRVLAQLYAHRHKVHSRRTA